MTLAEEKEKKVTHDKRSRGKWVKVRRERKKRCLNFFLREIEIARF